MPDRTIDIADAQQRLGEVISGMEPGEEIVLTDEGRPVARLVRLALQSRVPGLHLGAIEVSDDFDEPLPDEFWTGPDDDRTLTTDN
jgi:antitoxin (DNA-binding transcriptional repressor) of toxin-antitoxin stability system